MGRAPRAPGWPRPHGIRHVTITQRIQSGISCRKFRISLGTPTSKRFAVPMVRVDGQEKTYIRSSRPRELYDPPPDCNIVVVGGLVRANVSGLSVEQDPDRNGVRTSLVYKVGRTPKGSHSHTDLATPVLTVHTRIDLSRSTCQLGACSVSI
jgi:hypothetical protein